MSRYASRTEVPAERTRMQLDQLLEKHGATQRGLISDDAHGRAGVMFTIDGRQIRLEMTIPSVSQLLAPKPKPRGWDIWYEPKRQAWAKKQHEQLMRSRWRALLLVTKAKLEVIAEGLSSIEAEFLAGLVLPNGCTVGAQIGAQIQEAYLTGTVPPLLPAASPIASRQAEEGQDA